MPVTVRFGVSMDSALLGEFDTYCDARGYANRSEALRDLIRDALVHDADAREETSVAGTLTLVYDHHKRDLTQRLAAAGHDARHLVIATLHVHLDENNCLDVLALRGTSAAVRAFAERMLAVRGVHNGKFVLAATDGTPG